MAEKEDSYRLISVEGDDQDEVVFHAGINSDQSQRVPAAGVLSTDNGSRGDAAVPPEQSVVHESSEEASVGEAAADTREAPKTAQERQAERKRAENRKLAAEIAATEADLKHAGKMSKAQIATIIVCIVLLIVGAVYVVQTFIS